MKSATVAMDALLSTNGPFFIADLYTIKLFDGTVLRYTDADVSLTVNGNNFQRSGVVFKRTKTRQTLGLEASTMTVTISANNTQLLLGTPWVQAIRMGKLDGARIRVDRLIAPDWTDTSAGSVNVFDGEVQGSNTSMLSAELNVVSLAYKFETPLPINSYQPGCTNTLYDLTTCKLHKQDFTTAATVSVSISNSSFTTSFAGNAGTYYETGTLTFTSGPNAGLTRTIKSQSNSASNKTFTFSLPWPVQPSVGDAFTVTAACSKEQAICISRFNNGANFRATPYVPNPEAVS